MTADGFSVVAWPPVAGDAGSDRDTGAGYRLAAEDPHTPRSLQGLGRWERCAAPAQAQDEAKSQGVQA